MERAFAMQTLQLSTRNPEWRTRTASGRKTDLFMLFSDSCAPFGVSLEWFLDRIEQPREQVQ